MVKRQTGLPVEIHTHNDFGMGVATELTGVVAGAEVVHSCVNGLGERTGNAALEELVVGLQMLLGKNAHDDLHAMMELCRLVAKVANIDPARNKPVIGTGNYIRESGIGVDMVMKKPLAMFATAPQTFNREGEGSLVKKVARRRSLISWSRWVSINSMRIKSRPFCRWLKRKAPRNAACFPTKNSNNR